MFSRHLSSRTALYFILYSSSLMQILKEEYDEIDLSDRSSVSYKFMKLLHSIEDSPNYLGIEIDEFVQAFITVSDFLKGSVFECFVCMVGILSLEFNRLTTTKTVPKTNSKELEIKRFDQEFRKERDSCFTDTFYGQIAHSFKCLDCRNNHYNFEKFSFLSINPSKHSSQGNLFEALYDRFKPTQLASPAECALCKRNTLMTVQHEIVIVPEVLAIRLEGDNRAYKYAETVKIGDFCDLRFVSNSTYDLYAFAMRRKIMRKITDVVFVKVEGVWFEIIDEELTQVESVKKYFREGIDCLFYRRRIVI